MKFRDLNQGPSIINNTTIYEGGKQTNIGDFSNQKLKGSVGGQERKSNFITNFGKMIQEFFTKKIFPTSK